LGVSGVLAMVSLIDACPKHSQKDRTATAAAKAAEFKAREESAPLGVGVSLFFAASCSVA